MTRTVVIEPEADEDLSRAFAWYERTSPGMGYLFMVFVVAFAHVKRHPGYWHSRLPL